MKLNTMVASLVSIALIALVGAQQPKVTPGPDEPNWWDVLSDIYSLDMVRDLANPVDTDPLLVRGTFLKAGPGPVRFEPVLALGTVNPTRGGWYRSGVESPDKTRLWEYVFKHPAEDVVSGSPAPVPLAEGSSTEFDPGDRPFGLWISNGSFDDGGVFSEPHLVKRVNQRLAAQPYKAMIYPLPGTPDAYLIGWEYSTNDDFQDVVCVIRNVRLQ